MLHFHRRDWNRKAASVGKMNCLLFLLLATSSQLSQSCVVRYTRKEMEGKSRKGSLRGARNQNPVIDPDGDGIPGIQGKDYPVRTEVPEIPFSCDGLLESGLYGDPGPESRCQVFHRCVTNGKAGLVKQSFLCPVGSLFQQKYLVCDWWYNVNCSATEGFYGLQLERKERSHNPENLDPDSCLVLRSWNPLGKTGGASEATTCERGFGLYPSLENLPAPYSYSTGFVNTCERYCLQRAECQYYVYDCKLTLCELKMGNIEEPFVNNTRYITGKKTLRDPKECQNETAAGAPLSN